MTLAEPHVLQAEGFCMLIKLAMVCTLSVSTHALHVYSIAIYCLIFAV